MYHINSCDFIAGWISGVCGLAVGHPADTVKIRHQTFRDSGTLKIAYQTLKYEGVRGFYRGLGFPLLTAGALNSIFFGVYGNCLSHIQQSRGYENTRRTSSEGGARNKHWHLDVWLAGSVAGFVQLSLACPVDLVKIKLQTQTGKTWGSDPELGYRGPLECLSSTYRDYGIRGLYRGLPVMMWRDIPTFGLYMVVYETAQSMFKPIINQNTESHVVCQLIAGGGAGVTFYGLCQVLFLKDIVTFVNVGYYSYTILDCQRWGDRGLIPVGCTEVGCS